MLDKYSDLKQKLTQLFDRTTLDAITLLLSKSEPERFTPEPLSDWMTATQLARYWQLVNAEGEPITASIMKWTNGRKASIPYRTQVWEIFFDSIVRTLICGRAKKPNGDVLKAKAALKNRVTCTPSNTKIAATLTAANSVKGRSS